MYFKSICYNFFFVKFNENRLNANIIVNVHAHQI